MGFKHGQRALLLSAACILSPALALAQGIELDEIVISGGLWPVEAGAYGRAYTAITADEIEERGFITVEDALRTVPGVSVISSGETQTSVRVRGGEANHVLVLIDGVEANSSGNGDYQFTGLTLEDVDRIEVLRGPQSTLYGSNAMSGVIAITTKKAEAGSTAYGGKLEFGGLNTRAAEVYFRQGTDRGGIALSFAVRNSDGEDGAARNPAAVGAVQDTEFNNRRTLGLNGDYRLTDTVTAGFTLRRSWQEYGYDKTYDTGNWNWVTTFPPVISTPEEYIVDAPLTAKRDQTYGSLWLEADTMGGRLLHRFTLSGMSEGSDFFDAGAPDGNNKSTQRGLKYSGSYALDGDDARSARHKLNFALEAERETYSASWTGGGEYRRESRSVALEYQGRFENGVDVQAGIRRDANDVFKDATSWNLAAAWSLPGRDLRLRASVGKAVVNPTMFEQFGYVPGVFNGNPTLTPEESLGYEIGADLGFADGRGNLGVTLFHNNVKNMITGAGTTSVNVPGTSKRKGVEISAKVKATDWLSLGADYTYTDARSATGVWLARRPMHELGLNAGISFAEGKGHASVDIRHVSRNFDNQWWGSYAMAELPAFTTVNLAASYAVTDNVELRGRVVNLFDKDYSDTWGYYGQGRTFYVGVNSAW